MLPDTGEYVNRTGEGSVLCDEDETALHRRMIAPGCEAQQSNRPALANKVREAISPCSKELTRAVRLSVDLSAQGGDDSEVYVFLFVKLPSAREASDM